MKKILHLILTLVCILTALCGCDSLNRQPITLSDNIIIPEDGIIEASVFEALKAENKAVTFVGESRGLRYEWVVFGSDIKNPGELNLGLEITEANSEKVAFCFRSEKNFGFSPVLSIYLNDVWEAQGATLSEAAASDSTQKQDVSITGSKQSILNFSAEMQTGSFVITPKSEQDRAAPTAPVSIPAFDDSDTTNIPESSAAVSSGKTETSQSPEAPQETNASESPDNSQGTAFDDRDTEQDKYEPESEPEPESESEPEGTSMPEEPDIQEVDTRKIYTCTLSIECTSILNHLSDLDPDKLDILPKNGIIFPAQTVTFYEGETVYDVLQSVCRENKIHMEASWTPMYNSAYVEGIGNLYEFDCGSGSGWMYRVDGWYPNYGCSRYQLKQGDKIEWRYTCDLGKDIGGNNAVDN